MAKGKFTSSIPLSDSAASVIQTDVMDAYDPDHAYESEGMAPIREAFRPGQYPSLRFTRQGAEALASALCELSNRADELSRDPGVDEDEQDVYRRASSSLTTAMVNVRKAGGR